MYGRENKVTSKAFRAQDKEIEQNKKEADKYKELGNEALKQGRYLLTHNAHTTTQI